MHVYVCSIVGNLCKLIRNLSPKSCKTPFITSCTYIRLVNVAWPLQQKNEETGTREISEVFGKMPVTQSTESGISTRIDEQIEASRICEKNQTIHRLPQR